MSHKTTVGIRGTEKVDALTTGWRQLEPLGLGTSDKLPSRGTRVLWIRALRSKSTLPGRGSLVQIEPIRCRTQLGEGNPTFDCRTYLWTVSWYSCSLVSKDFDQCSSPKIIWHVRTHRRATSGFRSCSRRSQRFYKREGGDWKKFSGKTNLQAIDERRQKSGHCLL